ncbi:hypothetical protein K435DRAFT_863419 [Dendrothele bispora CBS 962.96]|uniref:Uncharacterized protein n=1 Tax=Dendrothele bispora (strain CBS 962.96) TaxID=1314807 RepID=A0A4S8LQ25_DENBC|nr:hypothetical protein K435DRAFT_863419 [Dendrothele bispora CBS 962.96]
MFNKSALVAIATIIASVGGAAAQGTSFTGVGKTTLLLIEFTLSEPAGYIAGHFDQNNLPADFTPCGGNCPPVTPQTLRIALPSTLFNGADVCCSTFTITYHGKTVQGTYAYKSSALAGTTNLVLADELFDQLEDNGAEFIFPVNYHL